MKTFTFPGGDCVSTRAVLAIAGVVAALLGTLGALGLLTLTGPRYVDIVGIMPFLLLGKHVNSKMLIGLLLNHKTPEY